MIKFPNYNILFLEVQCPQLDVANAVISSENTEYAVNVKVTCDQGHRLSDGRTEADVTCLHTARWSQELGDCEGMLKGFVSRGF